MKKFLVFLIVLVVFFSFGLVIARLLREDEIFELKTTAAYYNEGETIFIELNTKNIKKSTKITVESSNSEIVEKLENGGFLAKSKGTAEIVAKAKNAKGRETARKLVVNVGDGSSAEFPIYIKKAVDLESIGTGTEEEVALKLQKHYLQLNDITLTKPWNSIDGEFSGSYLGTIQKDKTAISGERYVKIKNFQSGSGEDGENAFTSAMFKKIASTGKVGYVTFEDVKIDGNFNYASVVAAENNGIIDFVRITGEITNYSKDGIVAAVAGQNKSVERTSIARIIRAENNASLTTYGTKIAGICYYNNAEIAYSINGGMNENFGNLNIITSEETINSEFIAGGIVGFNEWNKLFIAENGKTDLEYSIVNSKNEFEMAVAQKLRPVIKDCYSTGMISINETVSSKNFGGILGKDKNALSQQSFDKYDIDSDNLIIGNYYLIDDRENKTVFAGVGNLKYTLEEENVIGESNIHYVALGIEENNLLYGIPGIVNGESVFVEFISFIEVSRIVDWNNSGMYARAHLGLNVYPYLNLEKDYNRHITIETPAKITGGEISGGAKQFVENLDFTETILENGIVIGKKFILNEDIDFADYKDGFNNYFMKKGTAEKPAMFTIIANPKLDEDGNFLRDEDGQIIYYGFKNLEFNVDAENMGLFGYIKNSQLINVRFENCNFVAGETTKNIGIIAGVAENSEFSNCIFVNTEDTTNTITVNENVDSAGLFAGKTISSKINSGIAGGEILGNVTENAFAGLVAGKISGNSYIEKVSVKGNITLSDGKAGGVVGSALEGVLRNNIVSAEISSGEAGGFAHTFNGTAEKIKLNTTLLGNISAGLAVYAKDKVFIKNCEISTNFTGGNIRCGLVYILGEKSGYKGVVTSKIENVIFINNFSGIGANYAKTYNIAKQTFSKESVETIVIYDYNAEQKAGEIRNCFYINKVDGKENYNTKTTIFYGTVRASKIFEWFYADSCNPLRHKNPFFELSTKYYYNSNIWANGVISESGEFRAENADKYNRTYEAAGFSSTDWKIENGKIPTLKFN